MRTRSHTSARATAALLRHLPASLPSRRVWATAARTQARTLFGVLVLVDRTSLKKPCRGGSQRSLPALHFTHHSSKVPGSGEILIALAVTYAHVPCRRAIARIQVEIKEHERNAGMKREKAERENGRRKNPGTRGTSTILHDERPPEEESMAQLYFHLHALVEQAHAH